MILEELQKLTSHPTAPDLYGIVRKRLPKISLGTVYRNLELLTRHNVIKKLDLSGSVAHFDGNLTHHYHVRCSCCDQVDDLYELPVNIINNEFESPSGYRILGYRIEFIGLCPSCREKQETEEQQK